MKKMRSLLVVLLVAVSALCGCGSGITSEKEEGKSDLQTEAVGRTSEKTEEISETQEDSYIQPEMKGEITISCLYTEEFLDAATEQFMRIYPDVKITINSYKESFGEGVVEDYQTYLNTKIMTGKAEDILFTSFLPITKYSEMGVFEDLSGYITKAPEMNDENYFMNVIRAAEEDGREIYIIPYMARFDTLALSTELMPEHEDKDNMQGLHFGNAMVLAKQLVDETDKSNAFLIQMNAVSYADYLIKDSLGQFIDVDSKKVSLNTPEYIELLNSVKALDENGAFDTKIDFYNMEYYFAATCDYDIQAAYYSMAIPDGTSYCVPLADAKGRVSIKSNPCVALNSASDNKDLAWEFIKYLLSDEVQTLPSIHGPAVNRKGLEAVAERYYDFYKEGNDGDGIGNKEQYLNVLESWMEQINDCDILDSAIMTLIEEENNKFFSGQQTAEDTAQRLQRQIEQYFNE